MVLAEELEKPEDGLHHRHLHWQLPVLLLLPAPLHLLSQLKGQCQEMKSLIWRPWKSNQYFLFRRRWFLNCFASSKSRKLLLLSQLKGQCQEMNIFFEGLKNQISTYFLFRRRWFYNFLASSMSRKVLLSSCLLLWKHLLIIMDILPKAASVRIPPPPPPPPPPNERRQLKGNCEPQFSLWKCLQSIIHMLVSKFSWDKGLHKRS